MLDVKVCRDVEFIFCNVEKDCVIVLFMYIFVFIYIKIFVLS